MKTNRFEIIALEGLPTVKSGDSLAALIGVHPFAGSINDGDIVVIASKVVSISERRTVSLEGFAPSAEALAVAAQIGKDPRLVQLVLRESSSYRLASERGPIIARHHLGYELTSAGVDRDSNSAAVLLPLDPDGSARRLRDELRSLLGVTVAVIIADSDGRPDRKGATVIAIGAAGISPLRVTTKSGGVGVQEETLVDLIAAAAAIVIGQRGRGVPVAVARGVHYDESDDGVRSILLF